MNENRFGDRFGDNPLSYLLDKALKNTQEELKKSKEEAKGKDQEARMDELTGLPNRRALYEILPKMMLSPEVDYIIFSVLDLNRLKYVNDTYGHAKGDEMIKKAAQRSHEEAKTRGGWAFRIGGDELVLAQPGKGSFTDTIESISSRIQTKMNSNLSMPIPGGDFGITVSVGCSVFKKSDQVGNIREFIDNLLREADERMYAHKKASSFERGK